MAIAPGVLAMRRRVGYKRYRALHEFLKENRDPKDILLAVQRLVDSHLSSPSRLSVNFLVDEITIEESKERDELPLLIGTQWRSPVTQRYFEQLLKRKRKGG